MVLDKNEFATVLLKFVEAVNNGNSFDLTYDHSDGSFDMSFIDDDNVTLEGEISAVDDRISHIDIEILEIKNRITELVSELEDHTRDSKHDIKCIDDQLLNIGKRLSMIEDFCLITCNAISDDKKLCKRFSKACKLYGMNIFDFLSEFSRSNRFEPDI